MSIKNIVITGMLFLAGTIASAQTSADQIKEKNMEKLELVKEWDKVFPQHQPVHLEVGMGKGRFLMDMAKLHPESLRYHACRGYVYSEKCRGEVSGYCRERSFRGCKRAIIRSLRSDAGGARFSDNRFRSFLHG